MRTLMLSVVLSISSTAFANSNPLTLTEIKTAAHSHIIKCNSIEASRWIKTAFKQSMDGRLNTDERAQMFTLGKTLNSHLKALCSGGNSPELINAEVITSKTLIAIKTCDDKEAEKWISVAFRQAMDGRLSTDERSQMYKLGKDLRDQTLEACF